MTAPSQNCDCEDQLLCLCVLWRLVFSLVLDTVSPGVGGGGPGVLPTLFVGTELYQR